MKKVLLYLFIILIVGCETKGESFTFSLYGNPTTGYDWNCQVDKDIVIVEKKYTSDNKEITGQGGIYDITLEPIKKGNAILTCVYKRIWEESEDDETIKYEVNVSKNKKVTIKKK